MVLNWLSNPKHMQALYRMVLYKSSETVKIRNTSLLLSFILKTLFKILSNTSPNMIKITARKVLGYFVCALLLVVMKRMHLTVGFRTFSTSFVRVSCLQTLHANSCKVDFSKILHNYLNTKSLIMGFWCTVIYIFISLKTKSQTECTEN